MTTSHQHARQSYWVAMADEYLAITSSGIPDIRLAKKAFLLPGQNCTIFNTSPVKYSFEIHATAADKACFLFTAVFTIGPRTDKEKGLLKYACFVSGHHHISDHVRRTVDGIVEDSVRVVAAFRTFHDLFMHNTAFEDKVYERIKAEIKQYGLGIFNADFKQLIPIMYKI